MGYIGPRGISLDEWTGWSDYAQSAALAWQAREADACPQGHHRDLWDQDAGGTLMGEVRLRSHVCPACEIAQKTAPDDPWPGEYRVWVPLTPEDQAGGDVQAGEGDETGEREHAEPEDQA